MIANSTIKINVVQVMLEELVPHLIKIRHPQLASEINVANVIYKVLANRETPKLFAYNQKQLNQQKICFNQNHLFEVRKLVNACLNTEANRLSYRISNSVILISSRQREELIKNNQNSSFRETCRKPSTRNYILAG